MSEVGALIVKLRAETAEFREEMGKVKSDLNSLKGGADEAGEGITRNMTSSRESVMLLGEEVGVHMPRALSMFISKLDGVGAAMEMAFPIIGIVAIVGIIGKLIEKHEEYVAALRKSADEAESLSIKEMDTSKSMELANLKLDDQIAKLEGRPTVNRLKEALLESAIAVDKLEEAFAAQFEKINAEIEKTGGVWHTFWRDFKEATTFSKGFDLIDVSKAQGETKAALGAVTTQIQKIKDLEADLASSTTADQRKANVEKLKVAYTLLGNEEAAAANLVFKNTPEEAELYTHLAHAAGDAAEHVKQLGFESDNAAKKQTVGGLEEAAEAQKKRQEALRAELADAEQAAKEQTRVLTQEAKENEEFYKSVESQTRKGEAERVSIINEAMKEIAAAKQKEADAVLKAALQEAEEQEKAAVQAAKNLETLHKRTASETTAAEVSAIQAQVSAEVEGYQKRLAALDKYAKDYEKKVAELQGKIYEAELKGGAQITAVQQSDLLRQSEIIQQAYGRMSEAIATDIAKSIVQNKSLAQAFRQTGEEMAEAMIKNLIMAEMTGDKQKLIDAKQAFHNAMGMVPFPLNLVVAPAMFAATMAFEQGGEVPGSGAVPILAHGGETVVTKALTERVESAERGGSEMHMHNTFAPQIHAIDADGVDTMLKKHAIVFQRHVTATMRKYHRT